MGKFKAKRKTTTDQVTIQDATATNVQVKLNQLVHVSFMIFDGEESKSFKDLVTEYMYPAMLGQAQFIDKVVLGQYPQFLVNGYGQLGTISSSNGRQYILGTRNIQNKKKVYMQGRNLLLTPNSETQLLGLDIFTQAQQVGDDGLALREAWLGRKFGYNMYMGQNTPSVPTGNTTDITLLVNNTAGYAAGTTTLTVDTRTTAVPNNSWLTIAGDNTPLRVVSTVGGSTPTSLVVASPGLGSAVLNNAIITTYTPGTVNNSGGYVAGWAKEITVATFTVFPNVGQIVTFGTGATSPIYTVLDVDSIASTITLDRPLDVAINNTDAVNIGPPGDFNLAFHRNAMSLVVRPLQAPKAGTGALSSVVNYNGLSMRATITYQGKDQGHLVTLDMLCGIAVLDQDLGAVMYG